MFDTNAPSRDTEAAATGADAHERRADEQRALDAVLRLRVQLEATARALDDLVRRA